MVHNRCSASFADAVGLVSNARDSVVGSVAARAGAAARAHAAAAKHNSAAETIPGDTGWHAAPDLRASRAADCCWSASRAVGCLTRWNGRASGRIVVAALRLADRAGDAANPGSGDSAAAAVVVAVALRGAAAHADGFAPARRAAGPDPAAFFDLAVRAGDFAPSVVAVECVAGPDSAGHADDFVPSVVAVGCAAGPDSVGHAAAVVRRAVGRLVADHDVDLLGGVDSGAPVE